MASTNQERLLLRVDDAAHQLGIARSHLYALIAAGQIPVVRIGRSVRIAMRDLESFVDSQRQTVGAV